MSRCFRAACLAIFASCALPSQAAPVVPSFEVATVKPGKGGGQEGRGIHEDPGRLSARNVTVRRLIAFASSLEDYQIDGGPGLCRGVWETAGYGSAAESARR